MKAISKQAFSLLEVLLAAALLAVLVGLVVGIMGYGTSSAARLTPRFSVQQTSRKAVVQLLRELQESMEVLRPHPGSTLAYALVRDRLSLTRWYFQRPSADGVHFELWRYVDDRSVAPPARMELLFSSIRRMTFTCRTEGALQMNLTLSEGEQEFPLLTTVRLRNIASSDEIW